MKNFLHKYIRHVLKYISVLLLSGSLCSCASSQSISRETLIIEKIVFEASKAEKEAIKAAMFAKEAESSARSCQIDNTKAGFLVTKVEDAVTKLQDAIKKAEEAATRAEEAAKKTAESYGKVKESLVEVDKTPVDIRKVNFRIKADPKLNFYEGASHTLLLCMYQLTDENAFLQIAEAREGTQKLLECKKFDPSVTSYRNVLLQPGQEYNETRDLSDNVKYIGIVAGYYQNTDKAGHHRLFKAPAKGVKVDLYMGPLEIQ